MTTNTIENMTATVAVENFPDYPPRDDMQNYFHLSHPGHMTALERFYSDKPGVTVVSEAPISRRYGDYTKIRIPDLMVSFDSDIDLLKEQNGYAIDTQGGPPEFVLEVASVSTARRDEDEKRSDYASFGVVQYWRFDPTGGERYAVALAGDRLVEGVYRPIAIEWLDAERCRGWSEPLGLYVCWERGELRFFDPTSQQYLRTFDDEADLAISEGRRADAEAARADAEADMAISEGRRADAEAARADAEADMAISEGRRADAEAARADAEADLAISEGRRADAAENRSERAEARIAELEARLRQLEGQ